MIEIQLILYILNHSDWSIITDNDIDSSYFQTYKDQFEYIERYVARYNVVPDLTTFFSVYPDFESIEVSQSERALVDSIKYYKLQNYSVQALNNVREVLLTGSADPQSSTDKIASITKHLNDMVTESTSLTYNNQDDMAEMLMQTFLERESDIRSHFYSTGLDWFDRICLGWDRDNDYVVIAARPGVGKSMLACKFAAEQWKQGKNVAFYEGEMSTVQTMERIVSALSGISAADMLRGNSDIKRNYFRFLQTKLHDHGGSMNILTPQELGSKYATANQLEVFCKKTKADVLFIDQQSLMTDMEHSKVGFEKAGNISRQIKALRDKLNIPVITVVQQNRTQTDDGSVSTRQLAQSDMIGQDATKVIMLATTKNEDELEIHITKNRSGKSYVKQLYRVNFEFCTFEEIDDSQQQSADSEGQKNLGRSVF